jgi:hypothetical protein
VGPYWPPERRYVNDLGEDPVVQIEEQFTPNWGTRARDVSWPLSLRLGRV